MESCLAVTLIVLVTGISCNDDPCLDYDNLPLLSKLGERVVGYNLSENEQAVCDNFLRDDWYRMGHYILTSSKEKSCGTVYNWYMNGMLNEQTTEITVCKNDNVGCLSSKTIQVRKCKDYFVFQLKRTDYCSAYCVESITGGDTTMAPAPDISNILPKVEVDTVWHTTTNTGEHIHYCSFNFDTTALLYQIEWTLVSKNGPLANDRLRLSSFIRFRNIHDFRSRTSLRQSHLERKGVTQMGYKIFCTVRAKADITGKTSEDVVSLPKFCGIDILTRGELVLQNDDVKQIALELTVPFACEERFCMLFVHSYIPEKVTNDVCSINTISQTVEEGTGYACTVGFEKGPDIQHRNISIRGKVGGKAASAGPIEYAVFLRISSTTHPFMNNSIVGPIRVRTTENKEFLNGKTCKAHSDPHFVSFDGVPFDFHQQGVFRMYKNLKYQSEIQIKLSRCPNDNPLVPHCVHAIAVRAGTDVFISDFKEPRESFYCNQGVLDRKVKRLGSNGFEIYLPTGTKIITSRNSGIFMNVDITPGLADFKNTEGLCGKFNLDKTDEPKTLDKPTYGNYYILRPEESINFRINISQNLFDERNHKSLVPWANEFYFCQCSEENDKKAQAYKYNETRIDCLPDLQHMCYDEGGNPLTCAYARRKRSTDRHRSHVTRKSVMFDIKQNSNTMVVQKRQVYDEAWAQQECERLMNTSIVNKCTDVPNFNSASFRENCIADALMTSSLEWTKVHIEALKQNCIDYVAYNQPIPEDVLKNATAPLPEEWFNSTDYENETTVTPTPTQITTNGPITVTQNPGYFTSDLLDNLKDIGCPNDCNGNGVCQKGECICKENFFDIDCGLDIRVPPTIAGIPDLGMCDLMDRECAVTSVLGYGFIATSNLTCKMKSYKVFETNTTEADESHTVVAEVESSVEVSCPLIYERKRRSDDIDSDLIARGYKVSVSNDGVTYSEEDILVIYDSTCVNCTVVGSTAMCVTKPEYCMHEGFCYSAGNTRDCRLCRQGTDGRASWGVNPACVDDMSRVFDNDSKLWIIGAVLGPVSAVVLIAVGYLFVKPKLLLRKKQMSSVASLRCDEVLPIPRQ